MLEKKNKVPDRYFIPDDRICLIFDNYDYSSIRWIDEESGTEKGYDDLSDCRVDADRFMERIADFEFRPDNDIIRKSNSNFNTMR